MCHCIWSNDELKQINNRDPRFKQTFLVGNQKLWSPLEVSESVSIQGNVYDVVAIQKHTSNGTHYNSILRTLRSQTRNVCKYYTYDGLDQGMLREVKNPFPVISDEISVVVLVKNTKKRDSSSRTLVNSRSKKKGRTEV